MKLIMENWKRFLKEGVRPTGDPELPTWRSGSNVRAETDEIIAKAIELGLKRAKTLEDVSLVFDDARMEGDFSDSAAEKAEEEWVAAARKAGSVFTEAEYPQDDIAAVIKYAVQKGLRRETGDEEAKQIFAAIVRDGSYNVEDVEAAYEDWERYDLGGVDPDDYEYAL